MKKIVLAAEAAAAAEGAQIPDLLPAPLPRDKALRLAKIANVPSEQHDSFFDLVHWTISLTWLRDRRAQGSSAGKALARAAKAARTLHKEMGQLDVIDRQWVDRLWGRTPWYKEWLRDVPETTFRMTHLFSSAAGMSPPRATGATAPSHQKSAQARDRTLKNVMFFDFVRRLRMITCECGGKLTFDPNYETGSLIDALDLLRPHLPKGVIPKKLPASLKKVNPDSIFEGPIAEIDFYTPEQSI